jgi:hypothetical protein
LRKPLLKHSSGTVLRAIIHYNDFFALKRGIANCLNDPLNRALFIVAGDND